VHQARKGLNPIIILFYSILFYSIEEQYQQQELVVILGAVTSNRTRDVSGVQCSNVPLCRVTSSCAEHSVSGRCFSVLQIGARLQFVPNHCRTSCDLSCRSIDCHPYGPSKGSAGFDLGYNKPGN
jgi:hypothetical protein